MRREGFELLVGPPTVITKQVDGKTHEPFETVEVQVRPGLGTKSCLCSVQPAHVGTAFLPVVQSVIPYLMQGAAVLVG